MEPDAIAVLVAGIKQDATGRWVSTDLTEEDDALGAPGGALRVHAAAVLAGKYPSALVIVSGGRGLDVPRNTSEDRPLLAEISRDELVADGVPASRIVLEKNSNTTYQQLQELEKLIAERRWRNSIIVTNRYHLPRLRALIEAKFPALAAVAELVSAEEILLDADPARWKTLLIEAYASAFMAKRIAKEERGVEQIKDGTYQFH